MSMNLIRTSFSPFRFNSSSIAGSFLLSTRKNASSYLSSPFLPSLPSSLSFFTSKETSIILTDHQPSIVIYTDGSCFTHIAPWHAGIGVWIGENHPCNFAIPFEKTCPECIPTNNAAEIQAVTKALTLFTSQTIHICCDSIYVLYGYKKWKQMYIDPPIPKTKKMINREYFEALHAVFQHRKVLVLFTLTSRKHAGIKQAHKLANLGAYISYQRALPMCVPSSSER